jgi:hypothetical protein
MHVHTAGDEGEHKHDCTLAGNRPAQDDEAMNADTTATCHARNARTHVPEKKDRTSAGSIGSTCGYTVSQFQTPKRRPCCAVNLCTHGGNGPAAPQAQNPSLIGSCAFLQQRGLPHNTTSYVCRGSMLLFVSEQYWLRYESASWTARPFTREYFAPIPTTGPHASLLTGGRSPPPGLKSTQDLA